MGGDSVGVRPAAEDDLVDVMRLFDAAVLEADASVVSERIAAGDVLVAVAGRDADTDGRVVGALALDGSHVDAVAVQKERRGRGIGSRLVTAAADCVDGDLTADFDEGVREFYASLGFEIRTMKNETDRFRGRLRAGR